MHKPRIVERATQVANQRFVSRLRVSTGAAMAWLTREDLQIWPSDGIICG